MMHGQQNVKFCSTKQATQIYKYKNIKTKLYKKGSKYIEKILCIMLVIYQESIHDVRSTNCKLLKHWTATSVPTLSSQTPWVAYFC